MKLAFVVLGEGRGHMTQALALAQAARAAGHEVVGTLVGASPHRPVPAYFVEGMSTRVARFQAPTIVPTRNARRMSRFRTLGDALRRMPRFVRSIGFVREEIRRMDADLVVNFYDLIAGLGRILATDGLPPQVVIGHHYLAGHPSASDLPPGATGHLGLKLLTWGTALGASSRLALSFDELPPEGNRIPVPPLLRSGLAYTETTDGGYLLTYALNPGYAEVVARWQRRRPDVTVHCFVEGGESALTGPASERFHLHDLDGDAFLARLAGCRAYLGTAGFEAVCEAFYLGKPAMIVPVGGQYEQRFNAVDAERAGVAVAGSYDDLDRFWDRASPPEGPRVERFRAWVDSGPPTILGELEKVLQRGPSR